MMVKQITTDYDIGNGLDGTVDDIDGTEDFAQGRMDVTNGVVLGTRARQLVTKDGPTNALVLARH